MLSAQTLQDHETVIIDAVVAKTEKFSEVAEIKRESERERDCAEVTLGGNAFHTRAPATGNARSPSEDRRVAGTTTSVLEAERSLWRQ